MSRDFDEKSWGLILPLLTLFLSKVSAQAGLRLTTENAFDLMTCLSPPSAGIKGVHHHPGFLVCCFISVTGTGRPPASSCFFLGGTDIVVTLLLLGADTGSLARVCVVTEVQKSEAFGEAGLQALWEGPQILCAGRALLEGDWM